MSASHQGHEAPTEKGAQSLSAPALRLRRASERGRGDHGWLSSRHTFSFADYYDATWMGFRSLRVINEDRVAAGAGFPPHSHRDMDILSYVLEGALEHRDSMGNGSVIRPGDVQRMSAGRGVTHSEQNASQTESVHFLQIWLEPQTRGLPSSYEQRSFEQAETRGKLRLVAAPGASPDRISWHAEAKLYITRLGANDRVAYETPAGRHTWVHLARGSARAQGIDLAAGDAAFTSEPGVIVLDGQNDAEILVFDLA